MTILQGILARLDRLCDAITLSSRRVLAFFAAMVWVIYGSFLIKGYFIDDYRLIHNSLRDAIVSPFGSDHFRPLWGVSLYLSNVLFKSVIFDRVINYFLLALFIFMVFKLTLNIVQRLRQDRLDSPIGAPAKIALILGMFIMVLPSIPFHAVWISGRHDLLMGIFFIAALLFFYKNRVSESAWFLILALLSKSTILFTPLFFVAKSIRSGQKIKGVLLFLIPFIGIFAYSMIMLSSGHSAQSHLLGLSPIQKLLNHGAHLLEFYVTLIVPIPFFTTLWHGLIYELGFIFLLLSVRFRLKMAYYDFLWLFVLTSITSAMMPELRIATLHVVFLSLFVMSCVFGVRSYKMLYTGLILMWGCLLYSSVCVASNLTMSNHFDPNTPPEIKKVVLYPNNYYTIKRDTLIKLKDAVFND